MKTNTNIIELENIGNVRDLGGIYAQSGRAVKPGLFYRGGALFELSNNDRDKLFNELGISCVIVLRTGWERSEKPDPCIEGVENLHIPFYDEEKVGIEYTEPAAGTRVIGRDVACNPDHFYRSLANPLTVGQMRIGIHEIFNRAMKGQPVYVHCSGGKDRAGIMALLILTVLGANEASILNDYLQTNITRDRDYKRIYERFLRLANGNEKYARELTFSHRARPENITAFWEAVVESYGSVEDFIHNQLAISDEQREEFRRACTVEA